jgi:hypothetical protein
LLDCGLGVGHFYQSFTPQPDTFSSGISDSDVRPSLCDILGEGTVMSIDMPAALENEAATTEAEAQAGTSAWVETALTVLFTAAAVLFVSFIAVVTGLV